MTLIVTGKAGVASGRAFHRPFASRLLIRLVLKDEPVQPRQHRVPRGRLGDRIGAPLGHPGTDLLVAGQPRRRRVEPRSFEVEE